SRRKGVIASRFFGRPSDRLHVIAVTGTNGKTSCSHFVASMLNGLGRSCGVMGTLGFGLPGALAEPGLTTPGAIDLQSRLAALVAAGCDSVCLEASSHGLHQGRLEGTRIAISIFTNITRDHLDYHETFSDYKAAKRTLFHWSGLQSAVINVDDDFGRELAQTLPAEVRVLTFSTRDTAADVYASSISYRADGFVADIVTPWGTGEIDSGLLGEFNVSNLLSAVTVAGLMGYDVADVTRVAGTIETTPGRMDALRSPGRPLVVIDYAHTPDALEKALHAARQHCRGRLVGVVGCGGDRDRGKRPMMGRILAAEADTGIVTDDNPRFESSRDIIDEILEGIEERSNITVEPDRRRAIRLAIEGAGEDDVVVIAGKGHEPYQEIRGEKLPYSDYDEVKRIFEATWQASQ
ncbi:MAG: UDP-N-acetylmuramoyl-L-alanyl-D-glutamate--2,6-diaminopimelate ligase, partial [Pseudomonadales bacterium]|nr:UDP-N-acetylmuramoyl-L-alanyl-D-glutamate--2,6-diaminopimelate ligase [Pseudomonadales bacterium]